MVKKQKAGGLGNSIYSGAADFGIFMSLIGMIIGIIIGLCLIAGGIYFIMKKNVYTSTTLATVTNASCHDVTTSITNANNQITNNTENRCDLTITYIIDNNTITNHIDSNIHYSIGETFNIFYNPINTSDIASTISNFKILGGIMIGFALFIIGGVILQYYIVRRFKFAAAAVGVTDGIAGIAEVIRY